MGTSALPEEYLGGSENFTALGVTICGSKLSLLMGTKFNPQFVGPGSFYTLFISQLLSIYWKISFRFRNFSKKLVISIKIVAEDCDTYAII